MHIFGIVLFVIGIIVILVSRKDLRRRRRILDTPTSRIAEAPANGMVEIKGRIAASEEGVLHTPISGKPVVWYRVKVEEQRSSGRSSHWVNIITQVDGRMFYVDDGSGQTAKVFPEGAHIILDQKLAAKSGTWNDAAPQLEEFLRMHGKTSTGWLGFNKQMRYLEETLEPGDDLYALGQARREGGPPTNELYRSTPTTRLVLAHGAGEENELILTNKSENELVSKLRLPFIVGVAISVLGAGLGIAGLATM